MLTLLAHEMISTNGWLGLLFKVAIVCLVIWGIWELIKWMGWVIPRPVQIVFIVLVGIVVIYWLFQIAAMLL